MLILSVLTVAQRQSAIIGSITDGDSCVNISFSVQLVLFSLLIRRLEVKWSIVIMLKASV